MRWQLAENMLPGQGLKGRGFKPRRLRHLGLIGL
jgi:hypothetical protein